MRVNWAAVMAAAVADWLLGAVWFRAFANQWTAGSRMPAEQMQANITNPNFWPYLVALGCSILMAYVIARIVAGSESPGLFRGIVAGALVGLAAATAMITQMMFEIRSGPFILISSGYPFVGCILMGIIIGAWRHKAGPAATRPVPAK